jgi:hypothetical protein
VPVDDGVEPCRVGIDIKGGDVVKDVDEGFADLKDGRFGEHPGPVAAIDVAADGRDRGDARQVLQDRGITDVAGVNDEVAAAQRLDGFGAKKPMGVRDQANTKRRDRRGLPTNQQDVRNTPPPCSDNGDGVSRTPCRA